MSKLKTVDVPMGEYGHYAVEGMIEDDRHAIHTLLSEMVESKRKPTDGHIEIEMGTGTKMKVPAHSNEAVAFNQALDDILTLIDELFSDKPETK